MKNERDAVVQFGQALRDARREHPSQPSQGELAQHLGYSQSAVAGWELGTSPPEYPRVVFEIERFLALPPGYLAQYLGFGPLLEPDASSRSAIMADPRLGDEGRVLMLQVYDTMVGKKEIQPAAARALVAMLKQLVG